MRAIPVSGQYEVVRTFVEQISISAFSLVEQYFALCPLRLRFLRSLARAECEDAFDVEVEKLEGCAFSIHQARTFKARIADHRSNKVTCEPVDAYSIVGSSHEPCCCGSRSP